jgi:hypothetical protein
MQSLLATGDADVLFVAGWEENQVRFLSQSDHIVLLSAPIETLMAEARARAPTGSGLPPGPRQRRAEPQFAPRRPYRNAKPADCLAGSLS